ncbi:dihydrofolate reductase family protein [Microbulbifer sp. OS29]|uniref:Dihydrofolate reductase family protein n=1 Tax=Microbulbifer okhotskensis TaxID=2926617 RepID=A0A9X2ESG1_9GAMM|nr:dihydrofolate reductase family protein [Microbulbifer okhotskensis]MCO1336590.1 dihydrofolate reductase family protein [Microbulbifer okhotskensis]
MRKLAILTFQTLDGVMQAPSGPEEDISEGFTHGGWANECWSEVMEQVGREAMREPYDLLLGRNTYDVFASSFANAPAENPTAEILNQAKKYVVTSRACKLQWQNSEKITGNIEAEITRLKKQSGPLLQVHGSWLLIQTLLEHGLIDEYRLWTFPVVLGSGKRLFSKGTIPAMHKLIKFESCPSGAFMHFYRPSESVMVRPNRVPR